MKQVTGDLLKMALAGDFDVVVHGCNCFHMMGAGIAAAVKKLFPEAYQADIDSPYGDRSKLGTVSTCDVHRDGARFFVVNAYTQFHGGPDLDYDALRSCFRAIKYGFFGLRIGYPKIGAGIGGGDWSKIAPIIDEELDGEDHTLVVLP